MIIYGDTNAKISHNRIKWNIMARTEVPDENTPGQIGDVIVITSQDIKKLKFVATNDGSQQLQDNSINVYEDYTVDKILVNQSNGFNMYIFGSSQNIMLNGETIAANVYFYDGSTNSWVQFTSAYRDAINLNSFTGQNINIDEIWMLSFTDSLDNITIPPIVAEQYSDTVDMTSFSGCQLDLDDFVSQLMPTVTESATINNLTQNSETVI